MQGSQVRPSGLNTEKKNHIDRVLLGARGRGEFMLWIRANDFTNIKHSFVPVRLFCSVVLFICHIWVHPSLPSYELPIFGSVGTDSWDEGACPVGETAIPTSRYRVLRWIRFKYNLRTPLSFFVHSKCFFLPFSSFFIKKGLFIFYAPSYDIPRQIPNRRLWTRLGWRAVYSLRRSHHGAGRLCGHYCIHWCGFCFL